MIDKTIISRRLLLIIHRHSLDGERSTQLVVELQNWSITALFVNSPDGGSIADFPVLNAKMTSVDRRPIHYIILDKINHLDYREVQYCQHDCHNRYKLHIRHVGFFGIPPSVLHCFPIAGMLCCIRAPCLAIISRRSISSV